jgi:hypothetical protein
MVPDRRRGRGPCAAFERRPPRASAEPSSLKPLAIHVVVQSAGAPDPDRSGGHPPVRATGAEIGLPSGRRGVPGAGTTARRLIRTPAEP